MKQRVNVLTAMHPLATDATYWKNLLTPPKTEHLPVLIVRDSNGVEIRRVENASIENARELLETL